MREISRTKAFDIIVKYDLFPNKNHREKRLFIITAYDIEDKRIINQIEELEE